MTDRPRIAFKPALPSIEVGSARFRCYLPMRYLRAAGWDCKLFDPRRWSEYRIVVFQKNSAPLDIEWMRRLHKQGIRTVFDMCDDLFHNPDADPEAAARAECFRTMLEMADAVTVSTEGVARAVARPCAIIDDALDEARPDSALARLSRRIFRRFAAPRLRLVWFGVAGRDLPRFGLIDLADIVPHLNDLHERHPVSLTVISNSREAFECHTARAKFPLRYRQYRLASFQRHFRGHDLCIIPVSPNPLTLCKSINRPAISLRLETPVIADHIPSYEELRPFVLFGDWRENLATYADDPGLRRRHAAAGKQYVDSRFTPQHVVCQWESLLAPLAAWQGKQERAA